MVQYRSGQNQKIREGGFSMKKIFAVLLALSLAMAHITVYASDQLVIPLEPMGKMDDKSGVYQYDDPKVTIPRATGLAALPNKYDLRDQGRVTEIKNQKSHGTCWAFATMSSLESNLITKGIVGKTIDLSEGHLAWYTLHGKNLGVISTYAGRDSCASSSEMTNYYNAAATLARGYGAVLESDMPYAAYNPDNYPHDPAYYNEKKMTQSRYELQDAIFISSNTTVEKYDEKAYQAVKELIMKNGAVASKIAFPDTYDYITVFGSQKPNELETYYSKDDSPNHAVSVIGWDDDFYDFKSEEKPAGPGAWIIKDSYGTVLHGDGYFYVSYYTPSMSQFISYIAQKNSGRERYQYDGVGVGDYDLSQDASIAGSNCFTARTDLLIDQVMTFTPQADCSVNIKIYVANNAGNPASGTKLYEKTFPVKYSGYNRLNLGKKVGIPKGVVYSVVITTKTPDKKYFVPFELQDKDDPMNKPAVVLKGQSYININGKWSEITRDTEILEKNEEYDYTFKYRPYNALVKAFGFKGGKKAQKISVKTKVKMKKGKKLKLKARRTKGNGKLIYKVSDPKKATVTTKGVVKAKKKGVVKITIYTLPTTKYKSAKKTVKVTIK